MQSGEAEEENLRTLAVWNRPATQEPLAVAPSGRTSAGGVAAVLDCGCTGLRLYWAAAVVGCGVVADRAETERHPHRAQTRLLPEPLPRRPQKEPPKGPDTGNRLPATKEVTQPGRSAEPEQVYTGFKNIGPPARLLRCCPSTPDGFAHDCRRWNQLSPRPFLSGVLS